MSEQEEIRWVRLQVLDMVYRARQGHLGGSLSVAPILVHLYRIMRYDIHRLDWPDRDRLILSKGHACEALYAVLALHEFFPVEWLQQYRQRPELGGHPSPLCPGVEMHTGSMGHGLPVAAGIAYALKLQGRSSKVYCVTGDADFMEGSTLEALAFADEQQLQSHLEVWWDKNNQITLDHVQVRVPDWFPVRCWESPKAAGIPFMERQFQWHHGVPNEAEYLRARDALRGSA